LGSSERLDGADRHSGGVAVDRGNARESVDRQGDHAAVYRYRDVHRQQYAKRDEPGDVGVWNYLGGDDHDCRTRDRSSGGHEHDQRDFGIGERLDGADGYRASTAVDRGDAGESINRQGKNAAVYGDRNLYRQQHPELDDSGDVGVGDHRGGDNRGGWSGDWGRSRHEHDQCDFGIGERLDGADGDGSDTAVDCGDAGEPIHRQGDHAAVYGDGDLYRQQHPEPDEPGDVGVGNNLGGDNHGGRFGDRSRSRYEHDQRDFGIGERLDGADGYRASTAVDSGDAGKSIDRQGDDAAVHGDGDLHRQQHTEHDGSGDVGVGDDHCGDDHGGTGDWGCDGYKHD